MIGLDERAMERVVRVIGLVSPDGGYLAVQTNLTRFASGLILQWSGWERQAPRRWRQPDSGEEIFVGRTGLWTITIPSQSRGPASGDAGDGSRSTVVDSSAPETDPGHSGVISAATASSTLQAVIARSDRYADERVIAVVGQENVTLLSGPLPPFSLTVLMLDPGPVANGTSSTRQAPAVTAVDDANRADAASLPLLVLLEARDEREARVALVALRLLGPSVLDELGVARTENFDILREATVIRMHGVTLTPELVTRFLDDWQREER
jgi:hypothetical protein